MNTTWAGRRDASQGWIEFSQPGATVHKDGGQDLGTLTADKADVNGLNTKWVGDRDGGKGWIEFPQDGVDVRKAADDNWGTIAAGLASVNDLRTGDARVKGLLTVLGGMNLSHRGKMNRERGTLFSTGRTPLNSPGRTSSSRACDSRTACWSSTASTPSR
ncbi:hypothetical protein [Streptomyces varsoviensis]|uniref:hypothetical protein n=1 Tax=Streptomyces varsoviensis TaxID=67373 RepID=UPI0012FF199C|nr:hypothetical protein [Streptomyces varsoviensis]